MASSPPNTSVHRSLNQWAARVVPLLLLGIFGFVTWVVIVLIAVKQLLKPPPGQASHHGAGIAIIVVYFLVFCAMLFSYFRVVSTIIIDPGYVPLLGGPRPGALVGQPQRPDKEGRGQVRPENNGLNRAGVATGQVPAPPGLEQFYERDIFQCEIDGLPRWCSTCNQFKPDRSHHSSEVGRCVYKMDHFCPWAGGMVSETSFKFFVQFCTYACFYCVFVLIVSAYYLSKYHHRTGLYTGTYIATLALAAFFFLFTAGMSFTSLHSASDNTTSIDQLGRGYRIHYFAVLLPTDFDPHSSHSFPTVTFPLQAETPPPGSSSSASNNTEKKATMPPATGRTGPRSHSRSRSRSRSRTRRAGPRTFAILATPKGSNPYDLPSRLDNFKTVMGANVMDWILPLRRSPCASHGLYSKGGRADREHGAGMPRPMYKLGPVVDAIIREAGLTPPPQLGDDLMSGPMSARPGSKIQRPERRRRRRRRREEYGSQ